MSKDTSWEEFFDKHAPIYDENVFTKNTQKEIDFLINELAISPAASILDIGCGTGRHSVGLAKRGYLVTGVDLSTEMLSRANGRAEAEGVNVEWVHSDATRFSSDKKFDAAICLCEGAFGLLSSIEDALEHPLAILRNVSSSLKPGARVLFTVLNGFRVIRESSQEDVEKERFDPLTISTISENIPIEGSSPIWLRERSFVPTELVLLFQQAGMQVLNMWGGTAGNWKRQELNLDEMEIMVVARKNP